MPLCLATSKSVRAKQIAHCALCALRRPDLSGPSGSKRRRRERPLRSDARSDPASWRTSGTRRCRRPEWGDEALALCIGAVLQNRRNRPACDHQVRTHDAGRIEFGVDEQLQRGRRRQPVRLRPVRHQIPGIGQPVPAFVAGHLREVGDATRTLSR